MVEAFFAKNQRKIILAGLKNWGKMAGNGFHGAQSGGDIFGEHELRGDFERAIGGSSSQNQSNQGIVVARRIGKDGWAGGGKLHISQHRKKAMPATLDDHKLPHTEVLDIV